MLRQLVSIALLVLLASCKEDPANRKVVDAVSPAGHAFTFMPIILADELGI